MRPQHNISRRNTFETDRSCRESFDMEREPATGLQRTLSRPMDSSTANMSQEVLRWDTDLFVFSYNDEVSRMTTPILHNQCICGEGCRKTVMHQCKSGTACALQLEKMQRKPVCCLDVW